MFISLRNYVLTLLNCFFLSIYINEMFEINYLRDISDSREVPGKATLFNLPFSLFQATSLPLRRKPSIRFAVDILIVVSSRVALWWYKNMIKSSSH